MTIPISKVLEAAKASISSFTDVNVVLGTPVGSEPGLYVFAYMFLEDSAYRADHVKKTEAEETTNRGYIIRCLLMPNPSNNYTVLDQGLNCLINQPIFVSDEKNIKVEMDSISTMELSQIFKSAGVTQRLAIPFELRWVVN